MKDVQVGVMSERLTLNFDATRTPRETVEATVKKLGFGIAPKGSPIVRKKAFVMPETTKAGADDTKPKDNAKHDNAKHDNAGHEGHDHGSDPSDDALSTAAPKSAAKQDPGHSGAGHGHAADPKDREKRWFRTSKGKLVIGTALLLAAAWAVKLFGSETPANFAFIAACVIGVASVAVRAFAALRAGIPFTIEALMTTAAIGALFIGAAEEAALVVFLFAVGEVLEGVAADKARAAIRALADLVPKTAILEENGATREVDAASLEIGQRVLVRPGSRIPADGKIAEGTSGVDERRGRDRGRRPHHPCGF